MTGRTRWWLAAGVGLGLVLAAVVACRAPHTPDDGRGVPCALRGTALAQDGAGSGLDIDVTNVFGDGCFELRIVGACPCASRPTCASGSSTGSRGS